MAKISFLIAILSCLISLCGILPLLSWLTTIPLVLLCLAFFASVWQDWKGVWPISNRFLNFSIVPVFLFYAAQVSRANLVEPVVSLLAIMLAVRLLGEKSVRHYLQIYALSLFCLASSSLYDLSPVFLVYLGLLLFMVAVSLVLLAFHDHDKRLLLPVGDMRKVLASGLLIPLFSIPLLIGFFFLLPRTPFPLWDFLNTSGNRTSAFAEKVEPGVAPVAGESTALAFRAELPRQPGQIYWRGKVFNKLDGNSWIRDESVPAERIFYSTKRIVQTIYPEPGLSRTLIALDAPATLKSLRTRRNPDGTFEMLYLSRKRMAYEADSVYEGLLPVEGTIKRDFYLRLPADLPAKIKLLADGISKNSRRDLDKLENLEKFFRNGGYRYSLQGLPTGNDALEQFIFDKKQGHCEFFASAFAVLLRASGVPVRLVGGYLGGDYNELGGYYLVTEKMAHVWVEVFIEGKGWLRLDPSSFAENAGAVWSSQPQPDLWKRIRMVTDSIDHVWNRSVITYDFASQMDAAQKLGTVLQRTDTRQTLNSMFNPLLMVIFASGLFYLFMIRKKLFLSREQRLLNRFCKTVERDCKLEIRNGEQGLFEIADICQNKDVRDFVDIYARAVYRDRKLDNDEYRRLKMILDKGFVSI